MGETATVAEVIDGDTLTVRLADGTEETVRVVGIDTPETRDNVGAERRAEWEGIEDLDYLGRWGDRASEFAKSELAGAEVELVRDEGEPNRGSYGRLLRYVRYAPDGAGESASDGDGDSGAGADDPADAVYNRRAVAEGFARVYDSGFARHDDYTRAELAARSERRGVWRRSDPSAAPEIRDSPVDRMYVPRTASVRTDSGPVDDARVPVFAAESAEQERQSGVSYDERIPLVAVDADARVAVVGGLLVDERYEEAEGFSEDTSRYGNFPFLTNLLDSLSDRDGPVVIDGGHGQFNADYAVSAEDAAYYLRYLEGQDLSLRQWNSLTGETLSDARALLVSAPSEPFADDELDALSSFADDGGAVVLLGHDTDDMPAAARDNLNRVAAAVGSDLRLNADRITDDGSNLAGDPALPVTSNLNDAFDLFSAFTPAEAAAPVRIARVEPSVDGADYAEEVVLENAAGSTLDVSGWAVEDESGKRFEFPEGTTVPADGTVRLRTGDGTDAVVVHWARSASVWNDDGDTVSVFDEADRLVTERSY